MRIHIRPATTSQAILCTLCLAGMLAGLIASQRVLAGSPAKERPVRVSSTPALQDLRKRRDIREVEKSPAELKNLRHALFMLQKQKPTCKDQDARSEYDCWAAYHNNFELYGCRHRIDLFWPWHRYHLVEFEKALRGSDTVNPERTQNVTLPYWNWTQKASGIDFPASLEQENLTPGEFYPEDCPDAGHCKNPLWVGGRRQGTTCQSVKAQCVREALQVSSWRDFAGGESAGQISDFESQAHNFMHSRYIAGPMGNPTTAARDPIYWLFHAYIDNVWDQWQKQHQTDACDPANVPNPTRSLTLGDWPASTVTFKDVVCTKNLLYEYTTFGPPVAHALPSCPAVGAVCATDTPETPVVLTSAMPAGEITKAELRLTGVTVPTHFSYDAWILMHPSSIRYRPKDRKFINQYIATSFSAWRGDDHGRIAVARSGAHAATMDLQLDVTSSLRQLARRAGGVEMASTFVFTASSKAERPAPLVFGSDIDFGDATLLITTGGGVREIPLKRK